MCEKQKKQGFTLIELLLVLAIIGIISAIAIPALTGQRGRAKKIGDAQANAKTLSMMLESRKAENGIYGTALMEAKWDQDPDANATLLAPNFKPKGNSQMYYHLKLDTALSYTLTVRAGSITGTVVYITDHTGATKYLVKDL